MKSSTRNSFAAAAGLMLLALVFARSASAEEADDAKGSKGIWLSRQEILQLPMEGPAWEFVYNQAQGQWGHADLGDNDSTHDVKTLAAALVAARTGHQPTRERVIRALESAMVSRVSRSLELARGLQSYVIAADLIGYHSPEFEAWLRTVLRMKLPGHSGRGLIGTALGAPNNWGAHARASCAAAAIYLGDQNLLDEIARAHREFIGLEVERKTLVYTATTWHADPRHPVGINRLGATIQGHDVSGSIPEDMRRGDEFRWPPTETGYAYEGMQGTIVAAVILHRAGKVDIHAGDDAIRRAYEFLDRIGWKAKGDDRWQIPLANAVLGTSFPLPDGIQAGKGMGYCEWTHPRPVE